MSGNIFAIISEVNSGSVTGEASSSASSSGAAAAKLAIEERKKARPTTKRSQDRCGVLIAGLQPVSIRF